MRSDAYITVTCDECEQSIEIGLTALASGYDERDVDRDLVREGWTVDNGDRCETCSSASSIGDK